MSRVKNAYETPHLKIWSAAELDAIEATMSGGGGSGTQKFVYIVNTPDNAEPLINMTNTGHSALLFDSGYGRLELFSFSPFDNASPREAGAIATSVSTISTITDFERYCMMNDRQGIEIQNYHMSWFERFSRAIRLGVTSAQFSIMYEYACSVRENPPAYNVVYFNCQSFCNYALHRAGIQFTNEFGVPFTTIVPNWILEHASGADNSLSFLKFDF